VNYDNSLVVTITVTVTHGHHLAVTIYFHVAPSPGRHSTVIVRCSAEFINFILKFVV